MNRSQKLFEPLESRRLLSASVTGNGTLKVVGEEDSANTINVSLNADTNQYDVTINGETTSFDSADVRRLRISGGDEADTITVDTSVKVRASVNGNDGDDILTAGGKRTAINGGDGNDSITGSSKTDTLRGGAGNDTIDAGAGDDRISGDDGDDVLNAGAGDNEVSGGDGADTITATDGDDVIVGGEGEDSIDAGTGDDDVTQDNLEADEDGDCSDIVDVALGGGRGHHHGRGGDGEVTSGLRATRSFGGLFATSRIF